MVREWQPGHVIGDHPAIGRRVAVRVTKDALRQIRSGHPWVYDGSVISVRPDGRAGDLAVVFDDRRRFAAIGLYDPDSPIRVRVLHHGAPQSIDSAWLREKLIGARERRRDVRTRGTDGYRWVHGENDGLGGLVVDVFGRVAVVKLYSAAWYPHLPVLVRLIEEIARPVSIVLRLARNVAPTSSHRDGMVISGEEVVEPVEFIEGGLRFGADVLAGHKTGWFLDQRDNRARVRARSAGRNVLDVFSSAGGFSVNAAAGGAASVHSVDISAPALVACELNMARNAARRNVERCRHVTTSGDAREVMARLAHGGVTFDMVILDPPAFATRASQRDAALAAYRELTRSALRLLEPGGTLVQASCSSHVNAMELLAAVRGAVAAAGAELVDPLLTGHGADHPVGFAQGEYLAAVFSRVEPDPRRRR